ncbi:MAG: hypothetical protein IKR85_09955 [Clostridia bacterium]|nr:hypothetical protein [Clostridia bacterium]
MRTRYVLLLILLPLAIYCLTGCSGSPKKRERSRISDSEFINLFNENKEKLNKCAEILYSKPDFWKSIDKDRTTNWSLDLNKSYHHDFGEESWHIVDDTLNILKPEAVWYDVNICDRNLPMIGFDFVSSDSKPHKGYWKMIDLLYIPSTYRIDGNKYEYLKKLLQQSWIEDDLIMLDYDWYYTIHEENR